MKNHLNILLLCSMMWISVKGILPPLLKNALPREVKDATSKVVEELDKEVNDALIKPLQPAIDVVQMNVNPVLSPVERALEQAVPLLHNVFCYRYKSNLTNFLHYSPHHPDDAHLLDLNDMESLGKAEFDSNLPTKVIIHGFLDYIPTFDYWMIKMKNALLEVDDYNVIIVDWSCGTFFPYHRSLENAKVVADDIAKLLTLLKDTRGVSLKDVHIIGHSQGGQLAGLLGKRKRGLGRISGLDPAGPGYIGLPEEERLSPSDAEFVDVMHTDAAKNFLDGLGYPYPAGHVDFYPDGGETQKSCELPLPLKDIVDLKFTKALAILVDCNHYQAIDYYIESIRNAASPNGCQFVAVKCTDFETFKAGDCGGCEDARNCAIMGFGADKYDLGNSDGSSPNKFYLTLNRKSPYCDESNPVLTSNS